MYNISDGPFPTTPQTPPVIIDGKRYTVELFTGTLDPLEEVSQNNTSPSVAVGKTSSEDGANGAP